MVRPLRLLEGRSHCAFSETQPPAFTLILAAFTLTTNGLTLFVEGFCG